MVVCLYVCVCYFDVSGFARIRTILAHPVVSVLPCVNRISIAFCLNPHPKSMYNICSKHMRLAATVLSCHLTTLHSPGTHGSCGGRESKSEKQRHTYITTHFR